MKRRTLLKKGAASLALATASTTSAASLAYPSKERADPYRKRLGKDLKQMLGVPVQRVDLQPESRGRSDHGEMVVERWIWTSEPGSRVPSVLYRPKNPERPMPAVVITNGHGGSKSVPTYQYAGQLFAKMGVACLVHDMIGNEERHVRGEMGTRAHDDPQADLRALQAERLIGGKLIFDVMRGVDFLQGREDIDPQRIGVAGSSLGGAVATWMAALDPRLRMAIISGHAFGDYDTFTGKRCTRVPYIMMRSRTDWPTFLTQGAPQCATMVMNGLKDDVVDSEDYLEEGLAFEQTRAVARAAQERYEKLGAPGKLRMWFAPNGGHRHYHLHPDAMAWTHEHLGTPRWSLQEIRAAPTIKQGLWYDKHGLAYAGNRDLYWNERNHKGAVYLNAGVRPLDPDKLECLRPEEIGDPQYTLAGWLDLIAKDR